MPTQILRKGSLVKVVPNAGQVASVAATLARPLLGRRTDGSFTCTSAMYWTVPLDGEYTVVDGTIEVQNIDDLVNPQYTYGYDASGRLATEDRTEGGVTYRQVVTRNVNNDISQLSAWVVIP